MLRVSELKNNRQLFPLFRTDGTVNNIILSIR